MNNEQVLQALQEVGDLLDLLGEQRFKVEAYRRAARTLESLGEPLERIAKRNELGTIPGVGDALESKIRELLETGKLGYLEKLRAQVPPGIRELMRLPGVGPKTARRFWIEIKVEGPQELAQAIEAGKLVGVSGFGEKKIEQLRSGLAALGQGADGGSRRPILEAWLIAEELREALRSSAPVDQLVVAGSLRRRRETVGDLDILITSREPAKVFAHYLGLPGVREVRSRGDTKSTVLYGPGIQVDLRVVEPESFGAALQYFTGSKDHNVHIRTIARDRGLRVNEYGVFRDTERIAGRTEEEVYASLGLPLIPPEIRENHGEIEAATAGKLPSLVEADQVHAEFGARLPEAGEDASLTRWIARASALGVTEMGVVLADGPRLPARLGEVRREAAELPTGAGTVRIRVGLERAVGAEDPLPAGIEFLVLRPARGPPPASNGAAAAGIPRYLGGLELEEAGWADQRGAWYDWAVAEKMAIEVGPRPEQSGLDSGTLRTLAGKGATFLASARPQRSDQLNRIAVSLGILRRGAVPGEQVRTTFAALAPAPRRRRSR
ncbi:MAG TPA: helix-hairpin-helix domain-containing protein [Thermoplasmata archaeon]|nr:helix-hairpin-helix domain-containing protein [Thermoplasmata archaeon]